MSPAEKLFAITNAPKLSNEEDTIKKKSNSEHLQIKQELLLVLVVE